MRSSSKIKRSSCQCLAVQAPGNSIHVGTQWFNHRMNQTVLVGVGQDHLAGSRCRPRVVAPEQIWKGQHADAGEAKFEIVPNEWEPPEWRAIRDSCSGMRRRAVSAFGTFGNSSEHRKSGTSGGIDAGGPSRHCPPGRDRHRAFSLRRLIVSRMIENLLQKPNDDQAQIR